MAVNKSGSNVSFIVWACVVILAAQVALGNGNVHVSRFWHNHQPLYWPEWNSNGDQTSRGQYAWDSIVLKGGQNYGGISPSYHPENDLGNIFGLDDRRNAYQGGPRNSLTTFSGGGFALSYSGSLIDNVRQLGGGGHLGYGGGWADGNREARGWGRLDLVGFTYHHSLAPLLPKEVFRKELQIFKQAWWKAWNGNADLSDHSKGFFPTEMAYSRHLIDVLVDEGYEWVIVPSHHISRTSPSYNTKANPEGSYNIYSSPPNKADQLGPTYNDGWWYSEPNPGNAAWNVSPFAYQLHKVQYVNPNSGNVKEMVAVPSDDVLSYRFGYANEGIGKIQSFISPFATDPNRPVIVMPSSDGDNAWGGGSSSWMEATPQFFNDSAGAGYNKNIPGAFVNAFKAHAPVTHIEDGAWIFPEMCYGSPNFMKWIEPPLYNTAINATNRYPGTQADMETPGFALKFFSYAPLMAGANWVITAEQILRDQGGDVQAWKIQAPYDWDGSWTSPNDVELAWHIYLKGLDSGFNYYGGLGNDDEVKPALATKRAIDKLQSFMSTRMHLDQTPPTVLKPQRFPYNPGWYTFGWFNNIPGDTRFLKKMPSEFYVWTHAYDLSGITSIVVKVRLDNDGVNSMASTHNETYAGGGDVGSWISVPMSKRVLPKTRSALNTAASNGQIDYFVFDPAFWANPVIADYYFAKITDAVVPNFRGKLLDYYIEASDARGNTHKSEIQHVWVEDDGQGGPVSSVTFSADPRDCAPLTVTFNAAGGDLDGVSPVYQQISFDAGVTWSNRLMASAAANLWVYTNDVPDNAPSATVWFQNTVGDITDSNNGNNWSTAIRDCDAPVGPSSVETIPEAPSSCDPITIRYYPNEGPLQTATNIKIHIGRNGWTDVIDPNPSMTKNGYYWEYTYDTPTNTWQVNMVFNNGAGVWDNNSGNDWNVNVINCGTSAPLPTVSIDPPSPVGCGPITITYNPSGRDLVGVNPVYIHIGRTVNGSRWQDVILPNPAMTQSGANWTYTYYPAPGTEEISMVFNDGGAIWDNNGGDDWHFVVDACEEAPTGLVITNPPGNVAVANNVSSYTLSGVGDGVVGHIQWTNPLTGDSGQFAAAASWTLPDVVLGVGGNEITVRGTNVSVGGTATNARDNASDAAYSGGWNSGNNGGTGFGGWTLYSDASAGHFIGENGWGMWSHEGGNLSEAIRPFSSALSTGQTFSVRMKNGWIWESGGSVGVALQATNGDTAWEFFFNGGDTFYSRSHGTTDVGWTDAGIDIVFTLTATNTYDLSVTPVGGSERQYSGTLTGDVARFRAWSYNNGTGDEFNSNRDYFFNNLKITSPTPGGVVTSTHSVVITRAGDPWTTDSNADGIPDGWYLRYGFNPYGDSIANVDSDDDEATNWEEYVADTDPTRGASVYPNLINEWTPGDVIMLIQVGPPTTNSRRYDVWVTEDLVNPAWVPRNLDVSGANDGSALWLSVTNEGFGGFYRSGVKLP